MSGTAIEDLPMSELVKLFKKQVSLHGVAKFKSLLQDGDGLICDSAGNSVGDDDDSIDNLSSSSGSDDNNGSHDSSNDDLLTDEDQSENSSVDGNSVVEFGDGNSIHLHAPPVFVSRHCPPFESIDTTLYGNCDCSDFGMELCGQTDDFLFFAALNFNEEYIEATDTVNSEDRITSNLLRKRLYKMLFHATDFGILEKNERRKLPNCAVARIRQIYPSITGDYMGYKEN